MAAGANQRPIIIKKIKKVSGGGHHGGAWKVAYADFVTAMMAFFLLMWLINTTSPDQRRGIAEFFAPTSVSRASSGAGGLLAGTSFAEEGVRAARGAPLVESTQSQYSSEDANQGGGAEGEANGQQTPEVDSITRARTIREDAEFSRAEIAIRQAMQDLPEIAELSKQVMIDTTPQGLRIQIIDQEGRSMFAAGDASPNQRTRALLASMSGALSQLSNRIAVAGHTDGAAPNQNFASNWELSAARANETRRILEQNGVPPGQFYEVAGRGDSEPLFPDDPTLAGNRRITITLMRGASPLPSNMSLFDQ